MRASSLIVQESYKYEKTEGKNKPCSVELKSRDVNLYSCF